MDGVCILHFAFCITRGRTGLRSQRFAAVAVFTAIVGAITLAAQLPRAPLVLEPLGSKGEAIFPALEGWGPDKSGDNVILLGYYNRNKAQELTIPIGPDNRIEPGGPD